MGLLDLLMPERCPGCGADGPGLCSACRVRLVPLLGPLCGRCGAPVAWPVARCRECAGRRLLFLRARAAVAYEGPAVRLVAAWKEGGRRRLAKLGAEIVAGALTRPEAECLTFVPAAPDRLLWRGYNPAEGLARELGAVWAVPVRRLLARGGGARRQRGLSLAERRKNVSGAFLSLAAPAGRVVLVDDVYTTGATAAAAAAALLRGGAQSVEVVTFARALRDPGIAAA